MILAVTVLAALITAWLANCILSRRRGLAPQQSSSSSNAAGGAASLAKRQDAAMAADGHVSPYRGRSKPEAAASDLKPLAMSVAVPDATAEEEEEEEEEGETTPRANGFPRKSQEENQGLEPPAVVVSADLDGNGNRNGNGDVESRTEIEGLQRPLRMLEEGPGRQERGEPERAQDPAADAGRLQKTDTQRGGPTQTSRTSSSSTPSISVTDPAALGSPPPPPPPPTTTATAAEQDTALSAVQLMPPPPRPAHNRGSSLRTPSSSSSNSNTPKPSTNRTASLLTPNPRAADLSPGSLTLAPGTSTLPSPGKKSKKIILPPGHSPLDWAHHLTTTPAPLLSGVPFPPQRVTPSQLRAHNGRKGMPAWSAFRGRVYNVSAYAAFHPGGRGELMRGVGREAGWLVEEVHPWVSVEGVLGGCFVGVLVGEGGG